jgi:hypothetical protein
MGRGPELSDFIKGVIIGLKKCGKSVRGISKELNIPKSTIHSILTKKGGPANKKRSGRPSKLSDRDRRNVFKQAKKGNLNCSEIVKTLQLPVSPGTISKLLKDSTEFIYKKRKPTPVLTDQHKKTRLYWSEEKTSWKEQWKSIIFSDEKKWNLDGPDGHQYYWHHVGEEEQSYSTRQNGGGSVMVWGAFSASGKSKISFLEGNQTAHHYIRTLKDYLIPFLWGDNPEDSVFQQDNAPIHKAGVTLDWIISKGIQLLDWPARSPDLNRLKIYGASWFVRYIAMGGSLRP